MYSHIYSSIILLLCINRKFSKIESICVTISKIRPRKSEIIIVTLFKYFIFINTSRANAHTPSIIPPEVYIVNRFVNKNDNSYR